MNTRRTALRYIEERQQLGTLTHESAINLRSILFGFCEVVPPDPRRIKRRNVVRWMDTTRRLAPNTRRSYLSQVRQFCRWMQRRGMLDRDPCADVPMPKETRPVHRALEHDQVARLLAVCVDRRERVIVLLGVQAGLRRAELAGLDVADVALAARTVTVRRGKGGHSRVVPLAEEAAREVAAYLSSEGITHGPLLRSKRASWQGVEPQTVGLVFRRVAERAGVKVRAGDGVGVHSLRHTCASDVYVNCRDVMAVSDVLGHSSLNTTRRYVRGLDVERLRGAVEGRTYAA